MHGLSALEDGEKHIWNDLGFDVCNEALWSDEAFAHTTSPNQYNTFFRVKPYEVLNELAANDAIGTVYTTANSPALNEQINTYTLNEIFVDGADVAGSTSGGTGRNRQRARLIGGKSPRGSV